MWDDVWFSEKGGKIFASAYKNGCGCCAEHKSQEFSDEDFLSEEDIENVLAYYKSRTNDILKYKDAWLKQEGKI
jgi:hypothetical protein